MAETVALYPPIDHRVDLELSFNLPYGRIYNLSNVELKTLQARIQTIQGNVFIQWSSSPAETPILFAKKKDGRLRLWGDSWAVRNAMAKNRYPLPLISEMLDRLHRPQTFMKLNLRNAYRLIGFNQGNEDETACRAWCRQHWYEVMPFGLTNTPAKIISLEVVVRLLQNLHNGQERLIVHMVILFRTSACLRVDVDLSENAETNIMVESAAKCKAGCFSLRNDLLRCLEMHEDGCISDGSC